MVLLFLTACSEQNIPVVEQEKDSALSNQEITLLVDGWEPLTESRATLFDDKNFLEGNEENTLPGGNFTLYGYLVGKGTTFLGGARGWYFADIKEWRFRSGDKFPTYYWPNSDAVNFFAYMPYVGYEGTQSHYVTLGEYKEDTGYTFSCDLPESNANEGGQIEFIYAYEKNKTKKDNPLVLHFKHPFALVQFKLATGSYRMTVNSVALGEADLKGTFSTETGTWTSYGDAVGYTATIGKRIPNDVNYNTVFGGPYLVMPQDLANVTLTLDAKRSIDKEQTTETAINRTVQLKDIKDSPTAWEPGKIYTYILSLGDNNEEIYFNVQVEDEPIKDWIKAGKSEETVE